MPGESNFQRMQEEASRRMREMQSRARASSQRSGPARRQEAPAPVQESPAPAREPLQPEPEPPPQAAVNSMPHQEPETGPQDSLSNEPQKSILENLFQDKERTIILALLILLSNDGDHHELMFALMFLLM